MIAPVVDSSFLLSHPHAVVADVRWYLDGRSGHDAFRAGHLPGAIQAPVGKMLPMVVGSFVKPEERIVLVCDPARADEMSSQPAAAMGPPAREAPPRARPLSP